MNSDELKLGCDGQASHPAGGVKIFQVASRLGYTKTGISSDLMSHLARMQTSSARYTTITFSEVWLTVCSDDPFQSIFLAATPVVYHKQFHRFMASTKF